MSRMITVERFGRKYVVDVGRSAFTFDYDINLAVVLNGRIERGNSLITTDCNSIVVLDDKAREIVLNAFSKILPPAENMYEYPRSLMYYVVPDMTRSIEYIEKNQKTAENLINGGASPFIVGVRTKLGIYNDIDGKELKMWMDRLESWCLIMPGGIHKTDDGIDTIYGRISYDVDYYGSYARSLKYSGQYRYYLGALRRFGKTDE